MGGWLQLAFAVDDGTIWAAIIAVAGSAAGGVKAIWVYWQAREKKQRDELVAANKTAIDAKDQTIGAKNDEITRLRDEVIDLSKKLSKKSDDHAAKIQELMSLTLSKVEDLSERHREQQAEFVRMSAEQQAEFTAIAARFTDLARRYGLEDSE